jgi:hypothetical protein
LSFFTFSVFLPTFQVLSCEFLIFFSSFISIFQVLQCAFLIFHDFQCFSPYPCPTVCVWDSYSPFSVFFLPYSWSYNVHF